MELRSLAFVAQLLYAWSGFLVVAYQHQQRHVEDKSGLNEANTSPIITSSLISTFPPTTIEPCHVCETDSTLLLKDKPPLPWELSMNTPLPNFLRVDTDIDGSGISREDRADMTCGDWELFALSDENVNGTETSRCYDLVDYLELQCCDLEALAFPPVYECESAAKHALLHPDTSGYESDIAPYVGGVGKGTLDVDLQINVHNVQVVDFGVDGGAITLTGRFNFNWVDERLKFEKISAEMGCDSFQVKAESIWTPVLKPAHKRDKDLMRSEKGEITDIPGETQATIHADGRVQMSFWDRPLLRCHALPRASRECIFDMLDTTGNRDIQYKPVGGSNGVVVRDLESIAPPGYKLNRTATSLSIKPDDEVGPAIQRVQVVMRFDPLEIDCNVCGDDEDTKLFPNVVLPSNEMWMDLYPNATEWTCLHLDEFLINMTAGDAHCSLGRALFEESCCDDTRNNFECESNIHDTLVEGMNTITPPDPSADGNIKMNLTVTDADYVHVSVGLDIVHVMDIDIKTKTIEVLVGLELDWYDNRLSWEPFLGGCHRASFRASLSKEGTEIWVPNLELVNLREGVSTLPEATASVLYDGHVHWRRTGILKATCQLYDIKKFPFDDSICNLDFGGTRNPLYHRVKYVPRDVEFSEDVRGNEMRTREYQLMTDATSRVTIVDQLTGFSNEIIRYEFRFKRAEKYYKMMFVVLYILFTILSFGMFFIDYRLGERLGYGTSMLFVIVAQDITMAELTPITNQLLWINKISFASKIFVVAGIVQSIIVIYYFNFDDDDTEAPPPPEETIPFFGNTEECPNDDVKSESNSTQSQDVRERSKKRGTNITINEICVNVLGGEKNMPNKKNDSKKERKRKKLVIFDKISAIFFISSYTIFVFVMCKFMVDTT